MVGGVLLGGLILLCMTPVLVIFFGGQAQAVVGIAFGLAASILLAVYMGGLAAVWNGVVPVAVAVTILARYGNFVP